MSVSTDPFTFEMVRHKLHIVVREAMDALQNVSGSPSTSEALDMMVSLYDRDGNLMVGGVGFTHHITSAVQAVKHLLAEYGHDPGVREGDAYFLNDPYSAALHAPDVYIISPMHHDHERIGFVANFVHVTDVGGVDPGGFCPNAQSSYQEGFQSPGLRLVAEGTLRRDVLDTFLNMVRDPAMTELDIKSQLAANHVAKERMAALIAEFGVDGVLGVARDLVDESERRFRERLWELPNGEWRARQYVDAAGFLTKVELTATKDGDSVTYDFSGSGEQLPIAINCTYWASWGAVFAPIFPQLAWDLTWNEGITRPVRMVAPEGTIVNCIKPAPTSISTVGIVQVINNLSTVITSKMLGATNKYRDRATAVWHGSHASVRTHGYRKNGEYFISPLTDTFAGSGGASATHDGIDMGGEIPNVVSRWGNVERHELLAPIEYAFRRRVIDSGGPGKFRGGLGHEFAFTAGEDTASGQGIEVTLFGKGVRSPMSLGLFGGYPGCPIGYATFRELSPSEFLAHPGADDPAAEEHFSWGTRVLHALDLQVIRLNGGGGYGDPLDRSPAAVATDVDSEAVSRRAARDVYGVVFESRSHEVDLPGTQRLRQSLRAERVGKAFNEVPLEPQNVPAGVPLTEYLQIAPQGVQCTWCGHRFSAPGTRWKDDAVCRRTPFPRVYAHALDDDVLALTEFCCPSCGILLDCEVGREEDPPLYDDLWLSEPGTSSGPPGS